MQRGCCCTVHLFRVEQRPKAQANAGRGWLPLTKSHVEYLSKAGLPLQTVDVTSEMDPEDKSWASRSLGGTLENLKKFHQLSDGSYAAELAWADEKHVYVHCPEPRADWDKIKNELMFHLSVYKYLGPAPQCTAAMSALALVRHGVCQVTEDTRNDKIWGNGHNGEGYDRLGKIVSAILESMHSRTRPCWTEAPALSMDIPSDATLDYSFRNRQEQATVMVHDDQ